jgi:hypothetical protein
MDSVRIASVGADPGAGSAPRGHTMNATRREPVRRLTPRYRGLGRFERLADPHRRTRRLPMSSRPATDLDAAAA